MHPRSRLPLLAALIFLGVTPLPAGGQSANPWRIRPWGDLAVTYGPVATQETSNPNGVGLELSIGAAVRRLRIGAQYAEWTTTSSDLADPRWRARSIKGIAGFRALRFAVVTAGIGFTKAWDEVAPRGSIKASFAEAGVEIHRTRAGDARGGLRLCLAYDWALRTWDMRGPVPFGSMDQWHVGLGFALF